ncbi:MAG: hypothetical protein RL033_5734 [Pseudomonadota bacterium]|jgi:hypothetical protein
MHTKQTTQSSLQISREKLLTIVGALTGTRSGREDDDHPLPPGPWDPVIRVALERTTRRTSVLDEVALNPQPLPPRFAFLQAAARTLSSRAELLQELADSTQRADERQGIIIVGGYVSRFSDDWCGSSFRLRWPFPGPRPRWFTAELDGTDLIVIASELEQAARESASPELGRALADGSSRFVEAGLSKLS